MLYKRIIACVIALAVAAAVAFLAFRKKDSCLNVIPEDARAVMVLDPSELATELGVDIVDILGSEGCHRIGDSGISLTQPCYGFISSDGYLCGVFALSSASTLQDTFQQYGLKVEQQRGLSWSYTNSILVCFDSDKLLALGPVSPMEEGNVRGRMAEWMTQDEHTVALLPKTDGKSALTLAARMDVLDSPFFDIRKYIPKDVNLHDVMLTSSFSVNDKAMTMDITLQADDAKADKFLSELDGVLRPIQGRLLNVGETRPFLWAGTNTDGKQLLEVLRKDADLRTKLLMLNMIVDADMMIKSIDGDLCIELGDISANHTRATLTAQIKEYQFLQNAEDWKTGLTKSFGISLSQLSPQEFCLEKEADKYFFGVRDDMLYLASDNVAATNVCRKNSYKELNPYQSDIKGSRLYVTADVGMLLGTVGNMLPGFGGRGLDFDRLNLKMTDSRHIRLELTSKDSMSDKIKALLNL